MARNERAQWAQLHIDGVMLLADLAAGASLARLLEFAGPQLRAFEIQRSRQTGAGGQVRQQSDAINVQACPLRAFIACHVTRRLTSVAP